MAIAIDWLTRVINVPKSFLTPIATNLYELDLNEFRLALKSIEDDEDGVVNPDTHKHNTTVMLDGVPYVRVVEIINGYTVTFEAGGYAVILEGANSNVGSVTNINGVSTRSSNSGGKVIVETGASSGGGCEAVEIHNALDTYPNKDSYKADVPTPEENAQAVWDYVI